MNTVPLYANDEMPLWWNQKGFKTRLVTANKHLIVIENGNAAQLRLARISSEKILVSWKIQFDYLSKVEGQIIMSFDYVQEAFALKEGKSVQPEFGNNFRGKSLPYHAARPGYFIRFGQYLSIPGPNAFTWAEGGDLNIAIQIWPDIVQAVRALTE